MYYDCQWDRPMWLTRRLIAKISACLVLAAMLVAGTAAAWAMQRPEPFVGAHPVVTYGGVMVKKDHKFHIGLVEIDADGKDVTVLEVTPLMSENVQFLGAVTTYGMDNFKGGPGAAGTSFPPRYLGTTHPIGERIPAFKTSYIPKGSDEPAPVTVTAGFRLSSGIGAVNGIRIVYKIGNKKYTEIARFAAIACDNGCPQDSSQPGYYDNILRSHGLLPAEEG